MADIVIINPKFDKSVWPREKKALDQESVDALIDNILPLYVPLLVGALCDVEVIGAASNSELVVPGRRKKEKICVPPVIEPATDAT